MQGLAQGAQIVLACARGWNTTVVAVRLNTERKTVARWRTRFLRDRLEGLSDEPRPGVPRTITDSQVEEVVVRTLEETHAGGTRWSKRELATVVGISPASVLRIWHASGLRPRRTETFKISLTRCRLTRSAMSSASTSPRRPTRWCSQLPEALQYPAYLFAACGRHSGLDGRLAPGKCRLRCPRPDGRGLFRGERAQ
ncbi:helix-turn-helix domain-containing protein [Streptomyces sp. NBC_00513]|uniref:helix-turn-helix domain-containing protein n=1 Tax=unclassified Streptomyces TaxID=2593676 RepID=UPI0022552A9B|nr:helix-turn-helix domain-containing protein [Streptomyces sp. NBC_00424]MCX5079034.1 helix-turn-helix domain-containing protein [Streptomyces sp. NBC_00424]WUD39398.1 helix-turn-helix domain-containing protein [Streptomyces sp. NBC_00513]